MEIEVGHMVHLGYGKYWRSDEIVGLLPIENGRGPGRRTEVYVSTREDAVVASRGEQAILRDMAALSGGATHADELRDTATELAEELRELKPVLRRVLKAEGGFDVEYWIRRLGRTKESDEGEDDQEELFRGS